MLKRMFRSIFLAAMYLSPPIVIGAVDSPPALADLFAEPAYDDVKISPDGQFIGVIKPIE